MQKEMLQKIHEGHQGISKCLSLGREIFYWPNMSADIKNIVEQCLICAKFRSCNQKEPLQSYDISKLPWQQIGIDLMYFDGQAYLVATDYYSKYIEIASLGHQCTAKSVIINLKSIFGRHGIPMSLVSDGGPPFQSVEFKSFLYDWDIEHKVTSPYHSQSNGQAESSVKIIKNMLQKCKEANVDPYIALLHYRNTPKSDLPSPAQLLMSRNLRMNVPIVSRKLKPKVVQFADYRRRVEKSQDKSANYYIRDKTELPLLQPGDHIYFKKNPTSNWLPGVVKQRLSCQRSYMYNTKHQWYTL